MSRLRVLVAEDHPLMREAITELVGARHEVAGWVNRGDLVIDRALVIQPDVVLLDIGLPGASGLQVLPRLRSVLPDASIIMLTSHAEPAYERAAFQGGADAYILKNRAAEALLPAISSVHEAHRGNRKLTAA